MRELNRGGSSRAHHPTFKARIPKPVAVNNVLHVVESEGDNYVRLLAGLPPLPPHPGAPVRLIRLGTLAERLDCHIKTLKRRVEAEYGKLTEAEPAAAPAKPAKRQRANLHETVGG